MSNALKHTAAGGTLTIECEHIRGYCDIRVVDTGIGIPADELAKVFDRFSPLPGQYALRFRGPAFGLSIARALAEAQGEHCRRRAWKASRTTFVLSVPSPHPNEGEPMARILVVEDDPDARLLVQRRLGAARHLVTAVDSAEEALTTVDVGGLPDVAILDVSLPDVWPDLARPHCAPAREAWLPP